MVLGFNDYRAPTMKIAAELNADFAEINVHRFPDGETRITLPSALPEHLIICRSLNNPNEKLVELLLAAKTARKLGATYLTLIAPYLCYMRQDTAFNQGEAVSQTIIGEWLAQQFDEVITVDPHLHRVHQLFDVIPVRSAITLSAATLIGQFIREQGINAVLIGPDEESEQWVKVVATTARQSFGVCRKVRYGDRKTSVILPDIDIAGKHIILIDDIASSGGTLISAAQACLLKGAVEIDALVVHALFAESIGKQLADVGINKVWSCDSVVHPTNAILLAPLIASCLTGNVGAN